MYIKKKIENWQDKLLDLSKRNRLLNYRETKRSSLNIITPDCFSLWESLVINEKPHIFPNIDEYSRELDPSLNSFETNQNVKELQKTLRKLRDKAKIAKEEQGVNILYLSFGFLKWSESPDSEEYYNAPLILVPVKLTVESITSPFILSLHEDEIVINPTLRYKLSNDFGITLPVFDDETEIEKFFDDVIGEIINNKWDVNFNVCLSLLSFLKINMYNDIVNHLEAIQQNAVIRAISGDGTACERIPKEIYDFDFDRQLKPEQVFQVVDADSSQQEAILCAKKGISFVLQGPPGTGKSQTITNIIAECLADGKKVLFVSEKMAALEVVHKRLSEAKLNDFCLILHSHKANKREVLDQLDKVLKMAGRSHQIIDEEYQKLDALQQHREKLNAYAEQINEKIQPLGMSIYEVNGIIAHLESYEDLIFSIENIGQMTREQYNKQLYLLTQFSNTIGKMSDDYINNPWNGTRVVQVTFELRHDINANLNRLIPKINRAIERFQTIYAELLLNRSSSYSALMNLIPVLDVAKQSPVVPLTWIYDVEHTPLFDDVSTYEEWKNQFFHKLEELKNHYQIIVSNDSELNYLDATIHNSKESVKEDMECIYSILSYPPYDNWTLNDARFFTLLDEFKGKAIRKNDLLSALLSIFDDEILEIDYNGIYKRYKTDYYSFWKYFKRSYRNDKKTIQGLYKTFVKKVTDEMVLDTVIKLREVETLNKWFSANHNELIHYFGNYYQAEKTDFDRIESNLKIFKALNSSYDLLFDMKKIAEEFEKQDNKLRTNYQFLYKGLDTEWGNIREALVWAGCFRNFVQSNNLNHSFVEAVCLNSETAIKCATFSMEIKSILQDVDIEFQWFLSLFSTPEVIKNLELPALLDKIVKCNNNLFLLEEWIDFRNARGNCQKEGLADYILKIEERQIDKNHIIPIYKKRFFRLWLDTVSPQFPAILNFRRQVHESMIHEFSKLDTDQFTIAKKMIKCKLLNRLPQMDYSIQGSEISILNRELAKQRRIKPIRKLFREIPTLLLTLKPCFMMSPLSVSLFLEAESYKFDTVIFDEASQVRTENAIGAIFRGKQVIIAGDSNQLPPNNFFETSTSGEDFDSDDENDDSDETEVYDSILEEANALPSKTLRWHYRSRHEHLIAFSNAKIYRNELITFPSNKDKGKDIGVEYIFIASGFYDSKRGNVPEAKKVTELVFDHFQKNPERSLGVVAFGEVQQQAIENEIRAKRIMDKKFERFFNEENYEPFFVKNLENVQGDERDTIIFSIGYAKDDKGVFKMKFGPLSNSGGERRLNVAITRAKFNVKLVGSIIPTDIDLNRITNEGPKLLRGYIDFAINGIGSLVNEVIEPPFVYHDSVFEKAVYHFLERKGYSLSTQVGCSNYRIDMAVRHPNLSGIYVLGIECDGATYHSTRTARERDRLRQDVLEDMGWKLYRIWSTDWIKDPITEGEKLLNAVDEAIATYSMPEIEPTSEEKIDADEKEFVAEDNSIKEIERQDNLYPFETYRKTNFDEIPCDGFSYIEDCITALINNEYPIHYELLCQKIAPLFKNKKATSKIIKGVNNYLKKMSVYRRDNFFYPAKESKIVIRVPNDRSINHISIEEIAEAMFIILSKCTGGLSRDDLNAETIKVYGYKRSGPNISAKMNDACDFLLAQGKVILMDGKMRISI